MLANLLAVEPSAVLRVGFVDELVAGHVEVDGVSEFPLAHVVFQWPDRENDGGAADAGPVEPSRRVRIVGGATGSSKATPARQREIAAHLCFDQPLDSA
jgi:hypothetical protein